MWNLSQKKIKYSRYLSPKVITFAYHKNKYKYQYHYLYEKIIIYYYVCSAS